MVELEDLDIVQLEQLRDAVNQRILAMRQTRGLALPDLLRLLEEVKTTLHDQGKEWHSLERWQWMDGQVRFWLNPKDQTNYNPGWYTIDDLIAWGREVGPVIAKPEADDEPVSESGPWKDADGVAIRWLPSQAGVAHPDESEPASQDD
jgi:hypothetical protein